MQIKILSLTVKNCGALKDIKIDFTDNGQPQPVIVLGGANGSGKTTVLELIFALIELLYTGTHKNNGSFKGIFNQTEYAELELLIDKEMRSVFFYKPPFKPLFEPLFPARELYPTEESYQYENSTDIMNEDMRNLITLEQHKPISLLSETIPSTLYFSHNRELLPVHGEQINLEEIQYQWCYRYNNKPSFHDSLESYLIWLDYAEPEVFKSVIDFMSQLDFNGKTFHINRKKLSVMVQTNNGVHSFDKLSSGEQNILIILLELYRRLVPGSIVLLDEIENSLHPAFQHRLAQNLLKLQQQIPFQLILTTHQPAFVEIFGANCTRILTEF